MLTVLLAKLFQNVHFHQYSARSQLFWPKRAFSKATKNSDLILPGIFEAASRLQHTLTFGVHSFAAAISNTYFLAQISCFFCGGALCPPAVLSVPLATRAAEHEVHSYVLGPDIVPHPPCSLFLVSQSPKSNSVLLFGCLSFMMFGGQFKVLVANNFFATLSIPGLNFAFISTLQIYPPPTSPLSEYTMPLTPHVNSTFFWSPTWGFSLHCSGVDMSTTHSLNRLGQEGGRWMWNHPEVLIQRPNITPAVLAVNWTFPTQKKVST